MQLNILSKWQYILYYFIITMEVYFQYILVLIKARIFLIKIIFEKKKKMQYDIFNL